MVNIWKQARKSAESLVEAEVLEYLKDDGEVNTENVLVELKFQSPKSIALLDVYLAMLLLELM